MFKENAIFYAAALAVNSLHVVVALRLALHVNKMQNMAAC